MGRDLIISQHSLRSTLERVAEKSSLQAWHESQHNSRPHPASHTPDSRFRAIMEAAATDPIGLYIMARTLVKQETYQQAISHLARVRTGAINPNALMVRIHRMRRKLQTGGF